MSTADAQATGPSVRMSLGVSSTPGRQRIWSAGRPVDIAATLAPLRRGSGDPAHQVTPEGFWRVCNTPDGPATMLLSRVSHGVHATVWGTGAQWALDSVPVLLGRDDDWSALELDTQPVLARAWHQRPGFRLLRTGLVFDALVPAILEQRVTGGEAHRAWRLLLRQFGTPAPGPNPALRVPPGPAEILDVPVWTWHRFGVDQQRVRAIRAAATVAARLDEGAELLLEEAVRRLRHVPGVGEWTAAEVAQRALGHPDLVSVGDFHLHDLVVYALSGRPRGDDTMMLTLLSPWLGQRQRVVRLIELSGIRKPRFGPRFAPQDMRGF